MGSPAWLVPTPTALALGLLAAAVLAAGCVLGLFALAWERGLGQEPVARRRYAQLRRWLDWGHWRLHDSATPTELAATFAADFPRLAPPFQRIVARHVEATYGPRPILPPTQTPSPPGNPSAALWLSQCSATASPHLAPRGQSRGPRVGSCRGE